MPIETREEFCQRHGQSIRIGDFDLLFADGATASTFSGFQGHEAPDDERQRLEIQKRYWGETFSRISDQFARVRNAVKNQAPWLLNWDGRLGPRPNNVDGVALLEHLKAFAQEPKVKLAEIEAALAALPTNQAETERERRLKRALRKRQRQAEEQQRQAMAVTI